MTIKIPKTLYEKALNFIKSHGGFKTVEELVEFLLREALETETETTLSREEEEKVKERLRALGYL